MNGLLDNQIRTIVVFARDCRTRVNNLQVSEHLRVLVLDIERPLDPHILRGRCFAHVEYDGCTEADVCERWPGVLEAIERRLVKAVVGMRFTYEPDDQGAEARA